MNYHLNSCVHVARVSEVLQPCGHLHCLADLVLVHIFNKPGKQGFISAQNLVLLILVASDFSVGGEDLETLQIYSLGLFHGLYGHVFVFSAHHQDHSTFPQFHLVTNNFS